MAVGQRAAWAEGTPTFTRDVLPILQEHCQTCHRPGQIAPMSFLDYGSVRPWAKAIRKAVLNRSMPPFPAAGPIGRFEDDIRLTDEKIATIVSWVEGGGLRGAAGDAPAPVQWPAHSRQLDDPDLVIEFPAITSDPLNQDLWAVLYSDHVFQETTWIESYELVVSDASLIHHARMAAIDDSYYVPEERILYGAYRNFPRVAKKDAMEGDFLSEATHLDTWAPGMGVLRRPGGAFRLRAGERILMKAHIAPTSEARRTKVSLALRLAHGELATRIFRNAIVYKGIEIQPGEADYTYRGERKIRGAGWLRSIWVHMHRRGKSVRVLLRYANGESEEILDIPRWDFDWQRTYHLSTPIPVPPGTVMEAVAVWDNSESNPDNPDPSALVKTGSKTTDEMFIARAYISYFRAKPLIFDKGILISGDAE